MALGWSAAIRREAGVSGRVDFTKASPMMDRIGKQWAGDVARVLLENMARNIPVDTGYARGLLDLQPYDQRRGWHIGVLGLTGKKGEGLFWLALMDRAEGIKRHFVSFRNPDGTLRDMFVKWAERHGFKVWRTSTGRATRRRGKGAVRLAELGVGMAMGGLKVWGYSRPWATNAFRTAERIAHEMLQALQGALGKTQAAWSRYGRTSAANDFED